MPPRSLASTSTALQVLDWLPWPERRPRLDRQQRPPRPGDIIPELLDGAVVEVAAAVAAD